MAIERTPADKAAFNAEMARIKAKQMPSTPATKQAADEARRLADRTGLVGRTIIAVTPLPSELSKAYGWDDDDPSAPYLVLDDGTRIFPSQDEEGNGPGSLFWEHSDGSGGQIFANKSMGAPRRV